MTAIQDTTCKHKLSLNQQYKWVFCTKCGYRWIDVDFDFKNHYGGFIDPLETTEYKTE